MQVSPLSPYKNPVDTHLLSPTRHSPSKPGPQVSPSFPVPSPHSPQVSGVSPGVGGVSSASPQMSPQMTSPQMSPQMTSPGAHGQLRGGFNPSHGNYNMAERL